MSSLTDEEIEIAMARGEARLKDVPHARAAHFDPKARVVSIELTNSCSFTFPVEIVPPLQGASVTDLLNMEVLGCGEGLRWPTLDVDLSVPNLLAGLFGTRSQQARTAGATRSKAKAEAARRNGLKGGRPRRVPA